MPDLMQCRDKDRAQGDHDESQKHSAGKTMREHSDQACDHKCQATETIYTDILFAPRIRERT